MQFSSIITSIIAGAATVNAVATPPQARAQVSTRALAEVETAASKNIVQLQAAGCDVFGCISAYAPSIGICAAALAEPTPFGEIACFLAIVEKAGNPPASCNGCL